MGLGRTAQSRGLCLGRIDPHLVYETLLRPSSVVTDATNAVGCDGEERATMGRWVSLHRKKQYKLS